MPIRGMESFRWRCRGCVPHLCGSRLLSLCFACWQWWSPVSLCVTAWEVDEEIVAERLLDEIGFRPASYADWWDQALVPLEVDREALALALKTRCMRETASWQVRQYDSDVAQFFASCLGLLTVVKSEAEARQWLVSSGAVMRAVLRRRQ